LSCDNILKFPPKQFWLGIGMSDRNKEMTHAEIFFFHLRISQIFSTFCPSLQGVSRQGLKGKLATKARRNLIFLIVLDVVHVEKEHLISYHYQ